MFYRIVSGFILFFALSVSVAFGGPLTAAEAPPATFAPLTDLPGVVSWTLLGKVEMSNIKGKIVPKFPEEVLALNDKDVKVQGFMMPLEPGEKQKHFLLTVTSASCPYCMPAGPEGIVEIKSNAPVKFTFSPVVLSGKIAVMKNDPMGLFYRLTNASVVGN